MGSRLAAAAVLLVLVILGPAEAAPNFIYILADDLGYGHLGSYGQTKIQTPALDRMAAEGLRFTQHYAGAPVCAPSRTALLTGKHTGHARVRANRAMLLLPEDVTIAEALKQQGYVTAIIGKWGLGRAGSTGMPTRQGFDHFFGYLRHGEAQDHYPDFLWKDEEKVELDSEHYSHDLFTQEALGFIEAHRDRPFFLFLAYTLPHPALEVPEEALRQYDFDETPWSDYRYGRQEWPRAAFAAMVSRLDRDVGRILDRVEELGLGENTLVMFSSDNGPGEGGGEDPKFFDATAGLRGLKGDLYEGGIRVPFLARWPGTIEPGVTDHVSAQWDVFATLLDVAGSTATGTDGLSFLPTLLGQDQPEHEFLYWEYPELTTHQATRFGEWKAIRAAPGDELELYNLATDPQERVNVAEAHGAVVEQAAGIMAHAHQTMPGWPLQERSAWTWLQELRRDIGHWMRRAQGYLFPSGARMEGD